MDFASSRSEAEKWVKTENCDFELIASVESERRLVFAARNSPHVSFFLICPEQEKQQWHVWSDRDPVLAHLNGVQDYIGTCKTRTIKDVLNKTSRALQAMLGAANDCDSDEIDTDLDDGDDAGIDVDDYYEEEDMDAITDATTKMPSTSESETAESFFTGDGSSTAVHRILSDLKGLRKSEGKFGVLGSPRGDNLFIWDVQLTDFSKDTLLGKDLQSYAQKYKNKPIVELEMKFPKDYPMNPPFVRVLKPRFQFMTGHVTIGGSICMEVLTRSGWRPANDIEGILIQIRSEIMSDGKARLDHHPNRPYDEQEAKVAFDRMVQKYGWDK